MKDKVDPFMQPLYDALNDFLPGKQTSKLIEDKKIEIAPLAFMRGRTLTNAFVVLDEAQNATTMQMKMFLTRLGQGSRMVVTGDRTQIDLPRGTKSGLWEAEELLKKRCAVVQVWRPIQDVLQTNPLAFCDARSLPESDLIIAERRYPDRVGQTYQIKHNDNHEWFYYPEMKRDEAIVFKVWDSAKDGRARMTAHTSFDDPTTPEGAPPRESIEIRTLAFFD